MTIQPRQDFEAWLGVEAVAETGHSVHLRLSARGGHGNRNGTTHGGALASLAEIAGERAAGTPPGFGSAPLDLSLHYVAPATQSGVEAIAQPIRRGRAIAFVEIDLRRDDGQLVARALRAQSVGAPARHTPSSPIPRSAGDARPASTSTWSEVVGLSFAGGRSSGSPFSRALQIRILGLERARSAALLPDLPHLRGGSGGPHAGAIATLIDCVAGNAAWAIDGFDPSGRAATIALHLALTRSAPPGDVVALAHCDAHAGGVYLTSVLLISRPEDGTPPSPLGTGSVTYRISRPT